MRQNCSTGDLWKVPPLPMIMQTTTTDALQLLLRAHGLWVLVHLIAAALCEGIQCHSPATPMLLIPEATIPNKSGANGACWILSLLFKPFCLFSSDLYQLQSCIILYLRLVLFWSTNTPPTGCSMLVFGVATSAGGKDSIGHLRPPGNYGLLKPKCWHKFSDGRVGLIRIHGAKY